MPNCMSMNDLHHRMRRSQTPWYDEHLSKEEYRARCADLRNKQNELKAAKATFEKNGNYFLSSFFFK